MTLKQIILALLAALANALHSKAGADAFSAAAKKEIADRETTIAELHRQLDEVGVPLNEVEKQQVRDLLAAAEAATVHPEVPPPEIPVPVVASVPPPEAEPPAPVAAAEVPPTEPPAEVKEPEPAAEAPAPVEAHAE